MNERPNDIFQLSQHESVSSIIIIEDTDSCSIIELVLCNYMSALLLSTL